MNVLNMTALELYERGLEALRDKLGTAETTRFLHQCKPGTGDYTADRHNWLKDEPLDTSVKRLEAARVAREERVKAQRVAAWRKNLLELTDIELFEVALEVLLDQIGHYGMLRFFGYCHQNYDALPQLSLPHNELPVVTNATRHPRHTDSLATRSSRARTAARKPDETISLENVKTG